MKIKIEQLSKSYEDGKVVLKKVDLEDEVNTLALIGRSGCGKSTLLRILGGLIPASEGVMSIDGKQVEDTEIYRKKIGFVFQQGGLFKHLTAQENIVLPLTLVHKWSKEDADRRAEELLLRFGLERESHKRPSELSGGQQQRIAIARAVAPRPTILLLDEPTSALDPEYTSEVLTMIHELKKDGISFIIATHEMGFALHACDKVAFLNNGRIVEYEESNELFTNPKTEELKKFLSKLLEWDV